MLHFRVCEINLTKLIFVCLWFSMTFSVCLADALELLQQWQQSACGCVDTETLYHLHDQGAQIRSPPSHLKHHPHAVCVADVAGYVRRDVLLACNWRQFRNEFCDCVPLKSVEAEATFLHIQKESTCIQ